MDVYLQIDDQLGTKFSRRTFTLGRVCCKQVCKCEWEFFNARNGTRIIPSGPSNIIEDPTIDMNSGHDCALEFSNCMRHCRRLAISQITAIDPTFDKLSLTTQENDFLGSSTFRYYLCQLIRSPQPIAFNQNGYDVYVMYTHREMDVYPFREELHIGRLCCQINAVDTTIGTPVNRCP